jgi:cytidine deaminase
MTTDQRQALIAAALEARKQAHAPYSNFHVGAALLTASGKIITGCNVENASYGLTICAERAAICSAVAGGEKQFTAMAIATPGGHTPCGACRQVIVEFAPELPILLIDANNPVKVHETDMKTLLPGRFEFSK